MNAIARMLRTIICLLLILLPSVVFAQAKPLREIKVGYPLGGSSSYFWVAYRSGSFEKHGLKLEPIYIRGGLMGIQAALSGDLPLQLQGASTVVAAWAQGAKEFQFIGAVGNRLDYVLAAHPSIKRPEDLKGKRIGVSQSGRARISSPGWPFDGLGSILRRTCRSSALAARETVGPRSPPDRFKPACFNRRSP